MHFFANEIILHHTQKNNNNNEGGNNDIQTSGSDGFNFQPPLLTFRRVLLYLKFVLLFGVLHLISKP
jgi:hypothetical protein